MASKGEIRVNQAKRGYDVADDEQNQIIWYNPCVQTLSLYIHTYTKSNEDRFYMRYAPDEEGNFAGQTGYGYISFEKFVDAVTALNEGRVTLDELDSRGLPTLRNTIATTAILNAGRVSLDEKRSVEIVQDGTGWALK
jgi:D-galacturonate reductase